MQKFNLIAAVITVLPAIAVADHTTIVLPSTVGAPNNSGLANLPEAGETGLSIQYQRVGFKSIPTSEFDRAADNDESLHGTDSTSSTSFNFTWGASDRLTFGLSVPRIERRGLLEAAHHDDDEELHDDEEGEDHHEEESVVEQLGNASGIGDARLFANYQLFDNERNQASLILGIKAATGEDDELSLDGDLLEAEIQPGSDSWDPMLGFAYSTSLGVWSFDSNVLYSFVNEGAQSTNLGDVFNYNLALSYPLPTMDFGGNSPWVANFLIEATGEWRDRVEISGATEDNSGGNLLYFSPGVSISNGSWFASASYGLAVQSLNGVQSEPDNRFIFNFGRAF